MTGVDGCLSEENAQACTNNFLPPSVASVSFDLIDGGDVIRAIIEKIPSYMETVFTDDTNAAFTTYNRGGTMSSWDWTRNGLSEAARDDAIYTSYKPLMNYSHGEAGFPFRYGRSIWYMCTGLISQVMFTMPMSTISIPKETWGGGGDEEDGWMWTAASVLSLRTPALKFDPTTTVSESVDSKGLSAMEVYVNKLLKDSFADSPLFWHYALRHVPSESLACAKETLATDTRKADGSTMLFENQDNIEDLDMTRIPDYDMYGYAAFPIGSVGHDCFCGWKMHQVSPGLKECEIPADICLDTGYAGDSGRGDCRFVCFSL